MRGIQNPGNLCYLISALQCLLFVPQLTNYLLADLHEADKLKKRINACSFLTEYVALVRSTWTSDGNGSGTSLNAEALWAALAKVHKTFATRVMQHDAHEALMTVLQVLHDALGRTQRLHNVPSLRFVDRAAWDAHIAAHGYSLLVEMFQGQMRRTVRWDDGESVSFEHFWDLAVSIDGASSVTQAISRHMEPETLPGYTTDDGRSVTATIHKRFVYAPLVLVVTLKRFDSRRNKLDKFVDYTTEMELPCMAQGTAARYQLTAVCLHSGGTDGGHYAAMCTSHGHWFYLDDASVTELTDLNSIIQKDAYLLVYRKEDPVGEDGDR
jgi:ubiquitin C-terminal hydrolase